MKQEVRHYSIYLFTLLKLIVLPYNLTPIDLAPVSHRPLTSLIA